MRTLAALMIACLLTGAAFAQERPIASTQPPQVTAPETPSTADNSYVLGPGDTVRINVYNEPDLSVDQRVGPQGDITPPLIGNISATGLTAPQLADRLAQGYSHGYLLHPRITVTIASYRPFYIVGEVSRPGAYPFESHLTPAGAIAIAGGFTSRANRGQVFIKRANEASERSYPFSSALIIQPGDTVRIGSSFLATLRDIPFGLIRPY